MYFNMAKAKKSRKKNDVDTQTSTELNEKYFVDQKSIKYDSLNVQEDLEGDVAQVMPDTGYYQMGNIIVEGVEDEPASIVVPVQSAIEDENLGDGYISSPILLEQDPFLEGMYTDPDNPEEE